MTCVIFGDAFTFPEGDASTNRVYAYAKGFKEYGTDVHVICFRNSYLTNLSDKSEDIKYYHPFGRTERSKSFIHRRFQEINKYFNAYLLFREIRKREDIAFILCYTKVLRTQLFAFLMSRVFKSTLILERSEHPFKDYRRQVAARISGRLKVSVEIKFCDAIFCISDYLVAFYRKMGAQSEKLLKVPSTVDGSRFVGPFQRPVEKKYVCYCGSLTKLKDGVDILINSYAMVVNRISEVDLILLGRADTDVDEKYFRSLVSSLQLNDHVIFTGKL